MFVSNYYQFFNAPTAPQLGQEFNFMAIFSCVWSKRKKNNCCKTWTKNSRIFVKHGPFPGPIIKVQQTSNDKQNILHQYKYIISFWSQRLHIPKWLFRLGMCKDLLWQLIIFQIKIFKCIFFNENVWILLMISKKFVPNVTIDNEPALVQIMAAAWSVPSHYLNQCWFIVNWNLGNKLQLNLLQKFIHFHSRKCIWKYH